MEATYLKRIIEVSWYIKEEANVFEWIFFEVEVSALLAKTIKLVFIANL